MLKNPLILPARPSTSWPAACLGSALHFPLATSWLWPGGSFSLCPADALKLLALPGTCCAAPSRGLWRAIPMSTASDFPKFLLLRVGEENAKWLNHKSSDGFQTLVSCDSCPPNRPRPGADLVTGICVSPCKSDCIGIFSLHTRVHRHTRTCTHTHAVLTSKHSMHFQRIASLVNIKVKSRKGWQMRALSFTNTAGQVPNVAGREATAFQAGVRGFGPDTAPDSSF